MKNVLFFAVVICSISANAQKQTITTAWGNYVNTNMYGYGNTLLQVSVDGQNSIWHGLFSINGANSFTPDVTWNNVKLISYSGYNANVDDVKALIMSNTQPTSYAGTTIVIKLEQPITGSATITVVATTAGSYSSPLSLTDNSTSPPFTYTMASSAGTYNIWTVNNKVGIGTITPVTQLDLGDLRLGPISAFAAEGAASMADWGNYIIGDLTTIGQQLRLGVSNDLYTRSEIFLDNSNRQDGTIAFKTVNGSGGAITRMFINGDGNVGIGTTDTKGYKLGVNGNAIFQKVVVKPYGNWPDYVFDNGYSLRPLTEVERFIQQHHHLPELPSAEEVEKNGIDVGDNQAALLKKIEELTLYLIEIEKQNKALKQRVEKAGKQKLARKGMLRSYC